MGVAESSGAYDTDTENDMTNTTIASTRITNPRAAGAIVRRPTAGDVVLEQVFDSSGIWWRRLCFVSREEHQNNMSTTVLQVPGTGRRITRRGAYNVCRKMWILPAS